VEWVVGKVGIRECHMKDLEQKKLGLYKEAVL
jgi:hypothetical protein